MRHDAFNAQHLKMPEYHDMPQIHIGPLQADGEQTVRLGMLLPRCHMAAYIEGAPTLPVAELEKIVNAFREFAAVVEAQPTFSGAPAQHPSTSAQDQDAP